MNQYYVKCPICEKEIPKYTFICPYCENKGPLLESVIREEDFSSMDNGRFFFAFYLPEVFPILKRKNLTFTLWIVTSKLIKYTRCKAIRGKEKVEGLLQLYWEGLHFVPANALIEVDNNVILKVIDIKQLQLDEGTKETIVNWLKTILHPYSFSLFYEDIKAISLKKLKKRFVSKEKFCIELNTFSQKSYYFMPHQYDYYPIFAFNLGTSIMKLRKEKLLNLLLAKILEKELGISKAVLVHFPMNESEEIVEKLENKLKERGTSLKEIIDANLLELLKDEAERNLLRRLEEIYEEKGILSDMGNVIKEARKQIANMLEVKNLRQRLLHIS